MCMSQIHYQIYSIKCVCKTFCMNMHMCAIHHTPVKKEGYTTLRIARLAIQTLLQHFCVIKIFYIFYHSLCALFFVLMHGYAHSWVKWVHGGVLKSWVCLPNFIGVGTTLAISHFSDNQGATYKFNRYTANAISPCSTHVTSMSAAHVVWVSRAHNPTVTFLGLYSSNLNQFSWFFFCWRAGFKLHNADPSSPPLPPKIRFLKFVCFGAENAVRM